MPKKTSKPDRPAARARKSATIHSTTSASSSPQQGSDLSEARLLSDMAAGRSGTFKALMAILIFIPLIILGALILAFGITGIAMAVAGIVFIPVSIIALPQYAPIGLGALGAGLLIFGLGALTVKATFALATSCFRGLSRFFADRADRAENRAKHRATLPRLWWALTFIPAIAGIALLATGWGLGASDGYIYIDRQGVHVSRIEENSGEIIGELDLAAFTSIDASSVSARIELIPANDFGFEARLPEFYNDIDWSLENGKLTIRTLRSSDWRISVFTLGFFGREDYIKIYYPKNTAFDSIDLRTTSGDIHGSDLTSTSELNAKTVSGQISLQNSTWQNLNAETVSGDIAISGIAKQQTQAKTISGQIDLRLGGTINDYTYEFSSVSGEITINGQRLGSPVHSISSPEHPNHIKASTISGDINLNLNN